jgi:ubiquinone/menaquinone biosynthesis C-methylase UbiE
MTIGPAAAPQHGRLFPPEKLGMLELPDRAVWQRPDDVMDALLIGEGTAVADIGAGGGWFTMRLARRVGPNGVVYAQDIQPQMIEAIKRRVERAGLKNVITVSGTTLDPRLPARVDAALMVDSFHEMEQPVVLLRNVAAKLKPNGRIGIVEYTKKGLGPGPPMEERVDPERVIRDAEAAGLRLLSHETFLRYHYMLVFARK